MRINTNMMALTSYRNLSMTMGTSSKSMEKLSSGLRINRAADDAAGLAISQKMRAKIRGLNQASRNAQDSISMLQTADGAASNVGDMLQRMRELAVQASNETLATEDRNSIKLEIDELVDQIDKTAENTQYNGIAVINGGSGGASTLGTLNQASVDQLTNALPGWINDSLTAISTQLGITLPDSPTNRNMETEYYYDAATSTGATMGTSDGGASLKLRVNTAKVFDGGGNLIATSDTLIAHEVVHALQFTEMGTMVFDGVDTAKEMWFIEGMAVAIQGGNPFLPSDNNIAFGSPFDGDYGTAYAAVKTLHEITDGGINAIIDELEGGSTLQQALNNTTQSIAGTELAASTTGFADFTTIDQFVTWFNNDVDGEIANYIATSADFTQGTGAITNGAVKGSNSNLTSAATITNGTGTALQTTHFNLTFTNPNVAGSPKVMIGANAGETIDMEYKTLKASSIGVDNLDFTQVSGAQSAITTIDTAINTVSSARSYYGAIQNRLEHTISGLNVSSENLTSAKSRIADVDMASEMMKMTKGNILRQAAQSMLAQANQAPQGVLQLLR